MEDLRARAGQEMEAERLAKQQQEQDQEERQIASEKQQQQQQQQQQQPEEQSNETHAPGLQATATVPVPILPKLARMYISSKQHQASKAPPPPPPTAHWLVHSRPHPNPQVRVKSKCGLHTSPLVDSMVCVHLATSRLLSQSCGLYKCKVILT